MLPSNPVIQYATEALRDSDESTLTEYTNLTNSLSDLKLMTTGRANVKCSQPPPSQQLRDDNCRDTHP